MREKKIVIFFVWLICIFLAGSAQANKSAVKIEAPESVSQDSEVTIKVTVTHKGNSAFHYTKLLRVLVNKEEIARWDFSSSDRPESEVFSREVRVKANARMEIMAEASCNIHGSAGPATVTIKVENQPESEKQ